MDEKFLKPYNPAATEDARYAAWEASGYFTPEQLVADGIVAPNAPVFSMVLPPPNVTGTLHTGHAAMLAVEDILARFHRMRGCRTLWIPGTDSAALATQTKVESLIYKKEKRTRYDFTREDFLARVNQFAKESERTILNQVKKMGSSLDWSRYAFTLDERRYRAVTEAFVRMYEAGLIYRGHRIVNWDPKMQTTVSDDEVAYVEETTPFYYLRYGPFTIGTARPETKFGDKYVVMHPDDARYAQYQHGQKITVEWINGTVEATIIKDAAIDPEFGTGVMTITPWHDAVDFAIAERHGLDKEQIIDEQGKLLPVAGEFAGMHIQKARPRIVEKLKEKGLVVRVDERYTHRIATNSRGGGIIEPQIKEQWFVAVNKEFPMPPSRFSTLKEGAPVTLKTIMREAVASGDIRIMPSRFEKIYFRWIDQLHDWCISRQIWYGHRIPVWYRGEERYCGVTPPEGEGWEQDPDTLDTWFSSGLWTLSTLGWPEETEDLATYHPTSVLETGYDILFFWVARMILMTGFLHGEPPFRAVYLHGMVRDEKGRKMSKSLGNIIDPLDLIQKYGADALRLALIIGAAAGNDIKLSEERVRGYKHFANKLWNIARFVLSRTEGVSLERDFAAWQEEDRALIAARDALLEEVTEDLTHFRLHLAADKLYHYVWDVFAAQIIEESKPILEGADRAAAASRAQLLLHTLDALLRALHPFVPFVTEEIWQSWPHRDRPLLMVARWPIGTDRREK